MNVDPLVLVLAAAAVATLPVLLLARVLRELRRLREADPQASVQAMQDQLDALREQVRTSLDGGRLEIDRRLEATHRAVGEMRHDLGAVDRHVRSVAEAARELSGLQELLRSPKVRGGIGEYLLAELLAQVLPSAHFSLQHEFRGGERVDAVLRVGSRLVPVDAKFPLENFRRVRAATTEQDGAAGRDARRAFRNDVRRHVDAIARKYIRPGEATYEFAMMYVPSESVYHEILEQDGDDGLDLLHYALTRRVVPVSPQSFYAYLQVIVLGLRGLSLEGRSREIFERLGQTRLQLERFGESFDVLERHLGNAQRQAEEAGRRLSKVQASLDTLTD